MRRNDARAKEELLLLKKQLPYLGEEKDSRYDRIVIGQCDETRTYSYRPDYEAFYNEIYNTERACAEVIVGACILNDIYTFYHDLCLKTIKGKRGNRDKDEVFVLNHDPVFAYSSGMRRLLLNIRKTIDIGIESGDIGKSILRDPIPIENNDLFKTNRLFHSPSFLEWMKLNGFSIPDELIPHKNEAKEEPKEDKTAENNDSLMKKYSKVLIGHCQRFKDRGEQPPSRETCEHILLGCLRDAGEMLGPKTALPEKKFREVWNQVPTELKRPRGVTTKKSKKRKS